MTNAELHYNLLEKIAPPSVLVNETDEILHLSPSAGRFLRIPGGEPTANLLETVLPVFRAELRGALFAAKQEQREIRTSGISVELDGAKQLVNIKISPVKIGTDAQIYLLVSFEATKNVLLDKTFVSGAASEATDKIAFEQFEQELKETKDRLRLTVEQRETAIEELRASNEELQAINEELRAASEELETSKEELQSVNEELLSVNHELQEKIEEVSRTNADLQNLIVSTEIGTIFLDRALCIKRFTPPAAKLFGVIAADVGRPLEHLAHQLEYANLQQDAADVLENLQTVEREIRSFDNRWFIARFLPYRTAEDQIDGVVLTFIDITRRKNAEDEQARLLREVQAKEEFLREADRRKDEFLAVLAHELRNPLAPVRTGLEVLKSAPGKQIGVEARQIIERQIEQIEHLVDDLLDVSRITTGKIKLKKERIELSRVLELAIESSRPVIEKFGHKLLVEPAAELIFVEADATRLVQIFLNLLTNAAKFTAPNGEINLLAERENDWAIVRVKDNGVGIAPEKLAHVFELYAQIEHGEKREQGDGLGIGLSLVKKLVEMHGGAVAARSTGVAGVGSEFVVRLPISQQLAVNNQQLTASSYQPESVDSTKDQLLTVDCSPLTENRRILIVDDNADAAEMLQLALSLENYRVQTAFDGASALEKAIEFQPHIAVLDIGLPDIDGYQLAAKLRQKFPDLLIVALSGWGQDKDRERSQAAGFDFHFVKPIEIEKLKKVFAGQSAPTVR